MAEQIFSFCFQYLESCAVTADSLSDDRAKETCGKILVSVPPLAVFLALKFVPPFITIYFGCLVAAVTYRVSNAGNGIQSHPISIRSVGSFESSGTGWWAIWGDQSRCRGPSDERSGGNAAGDCKQVSQPPLESNWREFMFHLFCVDYVLLGAVEMIRICHLTKRKFD